MAGVHWIIQENRGAALDVVGMADALRSIGDVPHLVHVAPGEALPLFEDLPPAAPLVCHGPAFLNRGLHHPPYSAGLFFDPERFRWSVFAEHWAGAMLADGRLTTFGEASRTTGRAFVRPDEDSKAFDGGVYDLGAMQAHIRVPDPLPVILAEPIAIGAEWRFFIVDRRVVGCSMYRMEGRPAVDSFVPNRAIERAFELAEQWGPAEIYCLDLGESGERIGVVEANCFNAARFYAADGSAILAAVSASVGRTTEAGLRL